MVREKSGSKPAVNNLSDNSAVSALVCAALTGSATLEAILRGAEEQQCKPHMAPSACLSHQLLSGTGRLRGLGRNIWETGSAAVSVRAERSTQNVTEGHSEDHRDCTRVAHGEGGLHGELPLELILTHSLNATTYKCF